jgi:hypothetical protein
MSADARHYKKNVAAELETALSIITTAYLRNEDISRPWRKASGVSEPARAVVFRDFLTSVRSSSSPDVEAALHEHEAGSRSTMTVFQEWCDALMPPASMTAA